MNSDKLIANFSLFTHNLLYLLLFYDVTRYFTTKLENKLTNVTHISNFQTKFFFIMLTTYLHSTLMTDFWQINTLEFGHFLVFLQQFILTNGKAVKINNNGF